MIPFLFFINVVVMVLLVTSFISKTEYLGLICAMALMVLGVYLLINGINDYTTLLSSSLGIIQICAGFYIFFVSSFDELVKLFNSIG